MSLSREWLSTGASTNVDDAVGKAGLTLCDGFLLPVQPHVCTHDQPLFLALSDCPTYLRI